MAHQCCCGGTHDETELGTRYNLYEKIDFEHLECLNEAQEGSGATVFKTWENRLDKNKYVESDTDNELLFNIPFTGNIKLKGLIVIGGEDSSHPDKVKLYRNRPYMRFDELVTIPEQIFELCVDTHGVHEYAPKVVKFSSIHHLTLHFTGADKIRIYYIGLRGEWSPMQRRVLPICTFIFKRARLCTHSKSSRRLRRV